MRVGIDLGGTKIEIVALGDDGATLVRRRIATPAGDYDAILAAIVALVREVEAAFGPAASVGIGTPGATSRATGTIKNANSTVLIGRPFERDVSRALGRDVVVANDANCFALAEARLGAAAGARVVFGVILGTGVGGAVAVDGNVLDGANAVAGEWGHNPLPWPQDDERPGPACYCGKRGCVETFLAGPRLEAQYEAATGRRRTAAEIAEHAQSAVADGESAVADAVLSRYEDRLARGLATIVNVLDPDVIVLGGGISNVDRLYRSVPALLPRYVFSDRVDTRILRAKLGDSSGVYGAALLASLRA